MIMRADRWTPPRMVVVYGDRKDSSEMLKFQRPTKVEMWKPAEPPASSSEDIIHGPGFNRLESFGCLDNALGQVGRELKSRPSGVQSAEFRKSGVFDAQPSTELD